MDNTSRKGEKYILRQKNIWAKEINKTQNFMTAYKRAEKKGDLDIFLGFLAEIDKRDEFVQSVYMDLWGKQGGNLDNFATKVGIDELSSRFGKNLGGKLTELYSKGKVRYFDIHQLMMINNKTRTGNTNSQMPQIENESIKEQQELQLCKLLDLFTDDQLEVGIHRTGGSVSGKQIQQEGLYLTGHISSGARNTSVDLERNISFYPKNPGLSIRQVCEGGHYKNYGQRDHVDIVLVGIPKGQMKNTESLIVSDFSSQPKLSPKYVLGYVTVDNRNNTIDNMTINGTEIGKENAETGKTNVMMSSEMGTKDTRTYAGTCLEGFKQCSDIVTSRQEYQGIKGKLFNFLNKLKGKNIEQSRRVEEERR